MTKAKFVHTVSLNEEEEQQLKEAQDKGYSIRELLLLGIKSGK